MKKNLFVGNGAPSIHLLVGMRELGYNNIQAFCDILDNSIDAISKDGKGLISIQTNLKNLEKKDSITIIDNGCGMNLQDLSKALIFGKDEEREEDELGKFGMGLKSSALSMGKRLEVITKSENDKYYTGVFDYDEAFQQKSWNFPVITESSEEDSEYFKKNVGDNTGTIVKISKLDKLDDQNGDKQLDKKLIKSIAETFRNFISTSDDDDKIKFKYNGKIITPIDPMCRDMKDTFVFNPDDEDMVIESKGKKCSFHVTCFYVPEIIEGTPDSQSNMRHTAFGNSGFYIMRNNRQIQRGRWLFTANSQQNIKLRHSTGNRFRAELSFNSDDDDVFRTDTKKMTINAPQSVIDKIDNEVGSYLRGVQKMHSHKVSDMPEDIVKKNLEFISQKKNNKISTPTVLKNKEGKEIESVAPEIETKDTQIKRKEHNRNKNKKFDFEIDSLGEYGPFYLIEKMGIKKYVLHFNRDHIFYQKLQLLDEENGNIVIPIVVDVLHSQALTLYSELYDIYGGETKVQLIEEFLVKFSEILKKNTDS